MTASPQANIDTDKHAEIQAKLAHLLYRQAPIVLGGVLIAATVLAYMLWTRVPREPILIWLGLTYLLTAVRMVLVWRFQRQPLPAVRAHAWSRWSAFLSTLSGCLWGLIGILFFVPEQALVFVFIVFTLVGMTAGSVAALSAYWPAYYGFAIPTILPFAIRCLMEDGALFDAMGGLSLLYLAANLMYSRNIYNTMFESVRLQFLNLELLRDLNAEKAHVEAANRAKTRFLAAASHDLRQPIHALGLYAGALHTLTSGALLKRDALQEVAGKLQMSLNGLSALLNRLLDFSRLDVGQVEAHTQPVCIQKLVGGLQAEFVELARTKGIRFSVSKTSLFAISDPVLLRQMLMNLAANAVRYTSHGRVIIGCRRRKQGREVEIQVWDSGIGIPAGQIDAIFGEFLQLQNPVQDREQGLGLGLAIVHRTAKLLGHEIMVSSTPGKGSMFSITLPRTAPSSLTSHYPGPTMPLPENFHVLVIDDDAEVLHAMHVLIGSWGYKVLVASDADEAILALGDEKDKVQLILSDHKLRDDLYGEDAICKVRAFLGRDVNAAIITGDTSLKAADKISAGGFPVLYKPLHSAEIRALFGPHHLSRRNATSKTPKPLMQLHE